MRAFRALVILGVALAIAAALAVNVPSIRSRLSGLRGWVSARATGVIGFLLVDLFTTRGTWSEGRPAPTPKRVAQSAVIGGKLYVFGGFAPMNAVWTALVEPSVRVYDPGTDSWGRAADMPLDVTHSNAVLVDGTVWSAGGYRGALPGPTVANVLRYDVAADSWKEGPPLPVPTAGGTLALVGRTLHYVGGFLDRDTTVGSHWALAVDGGTTWEPRAALPVPRGHLASAVVGGRMYAIGGQLRHDTDAVDLDAVHAYEPARDTWTAVASLPGPRSHFEASTFVHRGRIIIVGGRDNTRLAGLKRRGLANVTAYDPATDTWTELPALPIGLQTTCAQVIAGRLIVTTGATGEGVDGQPRTFSTSFP
jgi:N-acetylneuraminic acid mutarotase